MMDDDADAGPRSRTRPGTLFALVIVAGVAVLGVASSNSLASNGLPTTITSSEPCLTTTTATTETTFTDTTSPAQINTTLYYDPIPFFSVYSSVTVSSTRIQNGTTLGVTSNETGSFANVVLNETGTFERTYKFNVIYRSPTTYKVVFTYYSPEVSTITENGQTTTSTTTEATSSTYWILADGTVLAAYMEGLGNQTGGLAAADLNGPLLFWVPNGMHYSQEMAESNFTQYWHSTGTSAARIGQANVTVTNYASNAPEEFLNCGNEQTINSSAVSIGTPPGATIPILTSQSTTGSTTYGGQTETFTDLYEVTAFTLA